MKCRKPVFCAKWATVSVNDHPRMPCLFLPELGPKQVTTKSAWVSPEFRGRGLRCWIGDGAASSSTVEPATRYPLPLKSSKA